MKVKFIEVGRSKKTWETECEGELTYEWLYSQAKKALFSSNIDFTDDGKIYAGFHNVGRFEIVT
ncbi:MAG: hypothetical protein ACM3TR_09675 [Caulobacteraceae bacterium]